MAVETLDNPPLANKHMASGDGLRSKWLDKINNRRFKRLGKRSLMVWITYQTIKGTLTTTFIWAPMIYYYFF